MGPTTTVSNRLFSLLLRYQIHQQQRLMGTEMSDSVPAPPLAFCIQSSVTAAPRGSSHFHSHTTGHVLLGGQRSLDCSCQLVWRRYWNGGQPRPTKPLPPRGESMEVQVPACLWNWPRPQTQVPVLWLASQHGSSPHLKHSQEEKFNTFVLPSCNVVVLWVSVSFQKVSTFSFFFFNIVAGRRQTHRVHLSLRVGWLLRKLSCCSRRQTLKAR